MLGLTRKEWLRMMRVSALLIVVMTGVVALYGAFGKADVLTFPARFCAGVGLVVGGFMYAFGYRMVLATSVIFVFISISLGAAIGIVITHLY